MRHPIYPFHSIDRIVVLLLEALQALSIHHLMSSYHINMMTCHSSFKCYSHSNEYIHGQHMKNQHITSYTSLNSTTFHLSIKIQRSTIKGLITSHQLIPLSFNSEYLLSMQLQDPNQAYRRVTQCFQRSHNQRVECVVP